MRLMKSISDKQLGLYREEVVLSCTDMLGSKGTLFVG